MKHKVTLTIASLLSILLMTFHLSDIVRGMEPGGLKNVNQDALRQAIEAAA